MRGSAAFRAAVAPGGVLAGPWVRNELWRRARAVPSLDLRFAESKSLTDAVTGQSLITITRASTGTYVGSDGLIKTAATNEARFDHNPTTGESLGLLVEEQRTNLQTNSQEFTGAGWSADGLASRTDNSVAAPDGKTTGATIVENSANEPHLVRSTGITTVSGTTYTASVFVKQGTRQFAAFLLYNGSSYEGVVADLSAGTIASTIGTIASSSITSVGNGWYRITITDTVLAVTSYVGIALSNSGTPTTSVGRPSYLGNGTGSVYIWGAQLEAGAFPTSYIPTTTAAVTRSADVASITGTAFSSWYRQDEGTVYGDFVRFASTNTQQGRIFSFSDGSNSNLLELYQTGGCNPAAQITATTLQAQWNPSGFTVGLPVKETLGYELNNSLASFGGSIETLDTACSIPTLTQVRIGDRQDGVRTLNGCIRRLAFWPSRLPNTLLQAITQ